ncbi:MAG: outer membrane protein transport protein [Candidatus Hydrogenedentota bacterium]
MRVLGSRFRAALPVMLMAMPLASAQELEFPISPTPVGAGARAAGMADAFVAIADDATASFWNPAGLVQLEEPEFSMVGSFNALREQFDDDLSGTNTRHEHGTQRDQNIDLNFMSYTHPLPWTLGSRNSTVSVSYHQKFDLSRRFTERTRQTIPAINLEQQFTDRFTQDGQLGAIGVAYAIEVTSTLSVGVTANLWRDTFLADAGWDRSRRVVGSQDFNGSIITFDQFTREEFENFEGENYIIGLLWNFRPKWALGIRYDTAFTADVDFKSTGTYSKNGSVVSTSALDEDREIHFPDTLAVGLSYRANDRVTMSMDITQTDWNDFYMKTASGTRISMVDSQVLGSEFDVDFDKTTTIRLGMEYLFIPEVLGEEMDRLWSLRVGLFYDEEPASGRPDNLLVQEVNSGEFEPLKGSGSPDSFYGFSVGAGVQIKQRVNIDFAYQLRYGDDVNSDYIQGRRGFSEDVTQHRVLLSTVVYF